MLHHELTSSERHLLLAVGCIWRSVRTSVMACLAVAADGGGTRRGRRRIGAACL